MRILLIQPARWASPLSATMVIEPLGLELIAAQLDGAHDVEILDLRWEDESLEQCLRRFKPQLVGATIITAEVNPATAIMKRVKEFDPTIVTVAGGPQAILAPEIFCGRYVDVAVTMEGDRVFPELVQALEAGRDLRHVPGLALLNGLEVIRTERRALIEDLSVLRLPNRSLTARYRSRYFRGEWKPLAASFTTRGCHYRCTFCCVWVLGGAVYRKRGIEASIADLDSIREPYVFMAEDDSMFDVTYSEDLARALISTNIRKSYQFYSRSDLVVQRPQLFELWAKAGMKLVLIGMEMTSDDALDNLNKENTTENNEKAARILESLGIEPISYFMVDPATFTKEHFKRLADYIMRLGLTHPIFFIMTPLPGTTQYRQRADIVASDDLDLFDFYHCVVETKMPLGEFYREFIELYRTCYMNRAATAQHDSAFSAAVVERFVARLEQEYLPYIEGNAAQRVLRTGSLTGKSGVELAFSVPPPPTLFPLKFKPGWKRPATLSR